ncbi:SSRP1 [Symbiodinium natans]|uniref:SSRP1 protein n=1 Tax=Symbiodinium natans TaxID=878477 RepID=A0A812MD29_9DINO|nr:SSRP1 [Symbiodinium natans]
MLWLHIAAPCMKLHWILFKTSTWHSDRPQPRGDESSADVVLSLGQFCSGPGSPGNKVIRDLVRQLREPKAAYRVLCFFHGPFQDWPQARKRIALRSVLITLGQLIRKVVEPFLTYPWKLWPLADPDATQDSARVCAEELFRAPGCCVDSGCSARIRSTSDVASCQDADFREFLQAVFQRVVLTSTFIERKFAHFSHWTDVKGQGASLGLLAAKHVTRSFRDAVEIWRRSKLGEAYAPHQNLSRPTWCRKEDTVARLNGYHLFSKDLKESQATRCRGAQESSDFLKDATRQWKALSAQDKRAWSEKARAHNARKAALQMAEAQDKPPDLPGGPWKMSTASEGWPLSEEYLKGFLESFEDSNAFASARRQWAHQEPEPVEEDLPLREEGNLFTVCAPGGCEARLSEDQKVVMRRLHTSLTVLVKRFDPSKKNISALPLTLLWHSRSKRRGVFTTLAFRTYTAHLDMILLEMQLDSSERNDLPEPPYSLKFKITECGTAAYFNDASLCVTLASLSDDWTVSRLTLGDLGETLSSLSVEGILLEDIDELIRDAARLKEEERALRAAGLMQRARRQRQRPVQRPRAGAQRARPAGRGRPNRRGRGPARREAAYEEGAAEEEEEEEEEEEAEAEAWLGDDEGGGEQDDVWGLRQPCDEPSEPSAPSARPSEPSAPSARPSAPSARPAAGNPAGEGQSQGSSSRAAAAVSAGQGFDSLFERRRAFRRVRQDRRRGLPWGPFQLQPIVAADGEQTGWGAVCGQHHDRDGSNQCKKAVSSRRLGDETCMLRLKRWLFEGLKDDDWPVHAQRTHHVGLGGRDLQDFAEGLSEREMDQAMARYSDAAAAEQRSRSAACRHS